MGLDISSAGSAFFSLENASSVKEPEKGESQNKNTADIQNVFALKINTLGLLSTWMALGVCELCSRQCRHGSKGIMQHHSPLSAGNQGVSSLIRCVRWES